MKNQDIFYSLSAVILLVSIAYLSVHTQIVEKISTVVKWEETPIYIIDTLTVTETLTDTLWEYRDFRNDILENDYEVIMNKSYLFHIAEDNIIGNQIRDVLPFGDVFNYWREQLGPCGVFEWNDKLYITLYKEEYIDDCIEWVDQNKTVFAQLDESAVSIVGKEEVS